MAHFAGILADLAPVQAMLLKATLLLAAGWILHGLLRGANPRWRVLLWRSVLAGLILLPIGELVLPRLDFHVRPAPIQQDLGASKLIDAVDQDSMSLPDPVAAPSAGPKLSGTPHPFPFWAGLMAWMAWLGVHWIAMLSLAYAGVTIILVLRGFAGAWHVVRVVRGAASAPEAIQRLAMAVGEDVGCGRSVEVRVLDNLATPFLTGIFKPVVILPRRMMEEEATESLRGVFAHELTHVKQHDPVWLIAGRAVSAGLWFHPLMWRVAEAHRSACEEVCDGIAAAFFGNEPAYSRTLARAALAMLGELPAPGGTPMVRSADISRRLRRLRKGICAVPLRRRWVWASAAVALVIVGALGSFRLVRAEVDGANAAVSGTIEMLPLDIKVVDESGAPVEGASVMPTGLRAKNDPGFRHAWSTDVYGESKLDKTDGQGIARIHFPRYADAHEEIGEVTVAAWRSGYVVTRQVDIKVDGSSPPIILEHNVLAPVSGYAGTKEDNADPLYAFMELLGGIVGTRPTATAVITVKDADGRPLAGAKVNFYPNPIWLEPYHNLAGPNPMTFEQILQLDTKTLEGKYAKALAYGRSAVTDGTGKAVVKDLPVFTNEFTVQHDAFRMPIRQGQSGARRDAQIELKPGETTEVTVRMERKGTSALGDSPVNPPSATLLRKIALIQQDKSAHFSSIRTQYTHHYTQFDQAGKVIHDIRFTNEWLQKAENHIRYISVHDDALDKLVPSQTVSYVEGTLKTLHYCPGQNASLQGIIALANDTEKVLAAGATPMAYAGMAFIPAGPTKQNYHLLNIAPLLAGNDGRSSISDEEVLMDNRKYFVLERRDSPGGRLQGRWWLDPEMSFAVAQYEGPILKDEKEFVQLRTTMHDFREVKPGVFYPFRIHLQEFDLSAEGVPWLVTEQIYETTELTLDATVAEEELQLTFPEHTVVVDERLPEKTITIERHEGLDKTSVNARNIAEGEAASEKEGETQDGASDVLVSTQPAQKAADSPLEKGAGLPGAAHQLKEGEAVDTPNPASPGQAPPVRVTPKEYPYLVYFKNGLSQPADSVREVGPYYEIGVNGREYSVHKDKVRKVKEVKAANPIEPREAVPKEGEAVPTSRIDAPTRHVDAISVKAAPVSAIVQELIRNLQIPLRFESAGKEAELTFEMEDTDTQGILDRIVREDPRYEVAKLGGGWVLRPKDSPLKAVRGKFSIAGMTREQALDAIANQINEQAKGRFKATWMLATAGTWNPELDQI